MEYLTKKFFVVQTPKINLKSQPTIIMEPSKLVSFLFAVPSCIFCSNIQEAFSSYFHYLFFFHKSQIKFFSNHLRIIKYHKEVCSQLHPGIEGCGYKDQACLFPTLHDYSEWCGCSSNHGVYCGYYWEYGDSLSHTAGMLWGDWRVCIFELLWLFFGKEVVFSTPPVLPYPYWSSACLTKPLFPQGRKDVTALRCSEPLWSKFGGPSKVFAILCRWDRLVIKLCISRLI